MFDAMQGEVRGVGVVVLPSGCLGERVPCFCLAGFGLLHAEQGGTAIVAGGRVLAEVAE
jgi:hypothetical protein